VALDAEQGTDDMLVAIDVELGVGEDGREGAEPGCYVGEPELNLEDVPPDGIMYMMGGGAAEAPIDELVDPLPQETFELAAPEAQVEILAVDDGEASAAEGDGDAAVAVPESGSAATPAELNPLLSEQDDLLTGGGGASLLG
jgi:hypothetical protein